MENAQAIPTCNSGTELVKNRLNGSRLGIDKERGVAGFLDDYRGFILCNHWVCSTKIGGYIENTGVS